MYHVADKRMATKFVRLAENLAPKILVPLCVAAVFLALAWFRLYRQMPDIFRLFIVFALIFAFLAALFPIAPLK